MQELEGKSVDSSTVIRAIQDLFKNKSDILPSSDIIIKEVCKFYGIEESALRGQSRVKDTSIARQVAMYLIRSLTHMSTNEIGREFDNRDHTTVLHALKRVEEKMRTDSDLIEIIKDIKANINSHFE